MRSIRKDVHPHRISVVANLRSTPGNPPSALPTPVRQRI